MRVLLVDDEDDFLEQTKIFLEKNIVDLKIDTSHHVEDALKNMEKNDYDAVISDYQMPGMDGLEFLKVIREENESDIPFIIFTGKGRENVAIRALNLGANRYIQKGGEPKSQYSVLADAVVKEVRSYKKDEKLKESERTYREIFEKAGIPIFIHDIDTYRVVNANEEAAQLYGYSKEEIKEKGVGSFSAGGEYDQNKVREQIEETIDEGPQTFIWRGKKKDGTKTWEEVKMKTAEIEGEKKVLAAIRDITELKRFEREKEKNLKELKFINDTVIKVSRMDDIKKICDYIGEQVHSVNEDSYIFVSLYDTEKEAITLRSSVGLNELNKSISKLFEDIKGMSLNPSRMGDEKNLYTSGNLEEVPGGLKTLLAGLVDEETCNQLEDILDIKKAYTAGFALEDKPYGGIIILKTSESDIKYKHAIETLTSHLSIMLQHKQEEEKRKKIEKRYNALFERSFDAIYIIDMDGDFIDANPRAINLLGYSMDEINSLTSNDIVPDESTSEIIDAFDEVVEIGAQEEPMEIELKRKDGSKLWVEAKTHLLYKDGKPFAFQGIARDITKRKEIEKKMKKKERAIQSSISGIVIADLDGTVNYVNDSLVDMWGYDDKEEILDRNTIEFFYDKEKTQKAIEELMEEGKWKGELKAVKKDGTSFDVFLSVNLIHGEDGEPLDILASIIDITKNKLTEKKIEKLHDVTRKLERCKQEEDVYDIAINAAEKILDFEMCTIDAVDGDKFVVQATSSNVKKDDSEDSPINEGIAGKT
ncbi:MAG: PAS domain S-box protein [Thermoplasmatota archaeon]